MGVDKVLWENRILRASFATGVLATFLFLLAYSSEYWVYVKFKQPTIRPDPFRGEHFKIGHYHGLWKFCREEYWYHNKTISNDTYYYVYCRSMYFSIPEKYVEPKRRELEGQTLHFRRSTVVIGTMGLVISIIANFFAWYSLGQLRYMFKRLTGALQLISAACTWVTVEVFRQAIMFEEQTMRQHYPEFLSVAHGWSYNLVWVAMILFLFPGVAYLVFSRKRKGRKARSIKEAQENEPVHLGRI